MADVDPRLVEAVERVLNLTENGRAKWSAPFSSINETLSYSTPRTTLQIAPMHGDAYNLELYDSAGTKVVDVIVVGASPFGAKVKRLHAAARRTVFRTDEVLDDLLADLEEEP